MLSPKTSKPKFSKLKDFVLKDELFFGGGLGFLGFGQGAGKRKTESQRQRERERER